MLNIEFFHHFCDFQLVAALSGEGPSYGKITDFLLTIIVILLLRRMQSRSKGTPPLQRRSSSTSHLPKQPPLAFRTLLKRRNQTIPAGQLYQTPLNPPPTLPRRPALHSEIEEKQQDIKEYVKTMGTRPNGKEVGRQRDRREASKVEDRQGIRSARSTRSVKSTVSSCRGLKKDLDIRQLKEVKTLEEVERRVETLISDTLGGFKKTHPMGASQMVKLDPSFSRQKQVQELLLWVKEQIPPTSPTAPNEEQAQNQQRWQQVNRKILLIQKLLARGAIEGEMMQQAYYNWKSQRGNTTSFSKSILKESSKYNNPLTALNRNHGAKLKERAQLVGRYDSTSKATFQRPDRQFYLNGKTKRNSYSVNRQPLPRSCYASQFLNYGHIPPYSHKPSSMRHQAHTSLAVTASTYQQEYKQKLALTSKVSFRELDCYRDKIQRSDISFMNNSKKQSFMHPHQKKTKGNAALKQNLNAGIVKRSQESLLGCMNMSTSSMFQSEHMKEFLWNSTLHTEAEDVGKAEIKDRRLDRLKESFRALAKRR